MLVEQVMTRITTLALSAALTISAGCDTEGVQTVGPRGGVVTSPDGHLMLEIPPGALDRDMVVTIGEIDEGPEGHVGRVYEIEPRLTTLDKPALLTYDVTAVHDTETRNLGLDDLVMDELALVSEKAYGWGRLADRQVDEDAGMLSASVMVFSSVALVRD